MAKVSTNIGLDAELKKSAQELFADFGMESDHSNYIVFETIRTGTAYSI